MGLLDKLKITPGPWEVEKCTCGSPSCKKYGRDKLYIENSRLEEPDARLIAAAPEMLEALVRLYDDWKYVEYTNADTAIRPIIEKATGRTWAEVKEAIDE